jgi:hypothetical protein
MLTEPANRSFKLLTIGVDDSFDLKAEAVQAEGDFAGVIEGVCEVRRMLIGTGADNEGDTRFGGAGRQTDRLKEEQDQAYQGWAYQRTGTLRDDRLSSK